MSYKMTNQAMIIETFGPLICYIIIQYSYQHYPAFISISLHFGLLLTFQLPNWQYIGIITQILWIPTNVWDTIAVQYPSLLFWIVPSWKMYSSIQLQSNSIVCN
jgi:hypothetical protein